MDEDEHMYKLVGSDTWNLQQQEEKKRSRLSLMSNKKIPHTVDAKSLDKCR